jgi:hypothetical protein
MNKKLQLEHLAICVNYICISLNSFSKSHSTEQYLSRHVKVPTQIIFINTVIKFREIYKLC